MLSTVCLDLVQKPMPSAQLAGYLEIHNSIYPGNYDEKLLGQFAEKLGIEDREEKIQDFLKGKR